MWPSLLLELRLGSASVGVVSSSLTGWEAGTEGVVGVMDDEGIGRNTWLGLLFILYERTVERAIPRSRRLQLMQYKVRA